MSTLPDLNTSNAGMVAYWNAINHGASSIDPSDILSDSNISSYTLYDNGFVATYNMEGVMSSGTTRDVTLRVKTDGWFVVSTDRTNTYSQNVTTPPNGYFDIANNWRRNGSGQSIKPMVNNGLERVIHETQSELSSSGSITYNASDVRLYNYEYTSASAVTVLGSARQSHFSGSGSSSATGDDGLIYTSPTTLYYVSAATSAYLNTYNASASGSYTFNSYSVMSIGNNTHYYSSADLLSNNLLPNPDTEYDMHHDMSYNGSRTTGNGYLNYTDVVMGIWS